MTRNPNYQLPSTNFEYAIIRAVLRRKRTNDCAKMENSKQMPAHIAMKLNWLRERLRGLGSAIVAFSAGVDSTLLLYATHATLGDKAIAATIRSRTFPHREFEESIDFCKAHGIRHIIVDSDELSLQSFVENAPDRCYHCKKAIFSKLVNLANEAGYAAVLEGSNRDDDGDFRPGRRAVRELGVVSPLHEAGLTKSDIRILSRSMGLPTWSKPSFACLASRIPYGERITAEALDRIERTEQWLLDSGLGLTQLRVRAHGDLARIEVPPTDIPRIASRASDVSSALKDIGFRQVSLDLTGYRTGSMNESLTGAEREAAADGTIGK